MSLETQIAALVNAANTLTNAVNGKISSINTTMANALAQFNEWRNEKDVEGHPSLPGTIRRNILQGHIYSTGGTAEPVSSLGAFESTNLGTGDNVYVHFCLPLNINIDTEMFWFNIRGYSYGGAEIIDETLVGYSYSASRTLLNVSTFGNMSPAIYTDSKGNVIMRLLFPYMYYVTMRVDTMRVGNGRLFNVGEITTKLSLAATVEF